MRGTDQEPQSFMIKLRFERDARTSEEPFPIFRWHGYITHVYTGERRYVQNLDDIVIFIMSYLERNGVRLNTGWRLWRLLHRPRRAERVERVE